MEVTSGLFKLEIFGLKYRVGGLKMCEVVAKMVEVLENVKSRPVKLFTLLNFGLKKKKVGLNDKQRGHSYSKRHKFSFPKIGKEKEK